jgi:hypothetical protein
MALLHVSKLPISKNQLDKLGDRLRDADTPAESDLELLGDVLAVYDEALQRVSQRLRDMGFAPTVRLKSASTLIDKLRRHRSSSLKTVQDLAGARIVIPGRLRDQDHARYQIIHAFEDDRFSPRIDDRRMTPSAGYRAVHVIVKQDGLPVEIQIRTELQNLWAQVFERLADVWGRTIRYGGDPEPASGAYGGSLAQRRDVVRIMLELSSSIADLEEQRQDYRTWPAINRPVVDNDSPELRRVARAATRHIDAQVKLETALRATLDVVMGLTSEE